LGFDLLSVSDHLHTDNPRYEPWTAITWIAAATQRLTVFTNVLALPYRHPAVLAKMADILARLSHHRLILGLGGGGFDHEFAAFGLTERSPGQKLTALAEAITIIRGLWSEPEFSLAGEQFHVTGARIEPRPGEPIPIWLGTYGPRSLRLTGAVADGWVPSFPRMTLEDAVSRRAAVRASAAAAGREPNAITCGCNVVVHFRSEQPSSPQLLTGTSQTVAEQLDAIIAAGFTCPIATFLDPADRDQFAQEVIPLLRHEHELRGG
jgi:alkanesulfonate monooxygenase SsuD/methylene tetrahydromethanopterin reductase-like flavin-dependent oxidoreductase (luciferase family)